MAAALFLIPCLVWLASRSEVVRSGLRARVAGALVARFPGATLTGDVALDGLFRLVAGPIVVRSGTAGKPPLVTVERLTVRPRLLALAAGRLEVASVLLDGVVIEAGARGEDLAALAHAFASRRARAATAPVSNAPDLAFTRASVRLGSPAETDDLPIALGPLAGSASFGREGGDTTALISLRLPDAAHGMVHLRWGAGLVAFRAELRRLGPKSLPQAWRAKLPISRDSGSLDVDIDAPRLTSASAGEARVDAVLRGLELRLERLSPRPVGPFAVRLTGTARWDVRAGFLALEQARLDLGESGLAGAPIRLTLATHPAPHVEIEVTASSLDWEALLKALPPALAPPPEAPAVRGTLAARLAVSGPLRRQAAWRVEGDIDPSALEPAPTRPGAIDLRRSFTWAGPLPDGRTRKVLVGPQNPAFVPIDALPPHVVRAVLTSEDAGFYGHHGFDVGEIRDALARSGGRRLRGASTITQQIAKNLFLSMERTYARKIREALTTVALESSVDKRRLLEIYLNMAEWGPGVFGIGEAAHHWFGKDARDLTPKEAAFLATVIPNPIRYEMYRRRGALTEAWEERVRGLLEKLRAADVISDEQLLEAREAPLTFARGA